MVKPILGQDIESFDGKKVFCREWTIAKPKAVVMIFHGMVEHSGRYHEFAKFLNAKGYNVFCFDLRGHGETADGVENISLYDGDLFADCVKDGMFFADMLLEKYKLPLVVMGHSFGSFLLQSFIQQYHKHNIAIFSGSACMKGQASVAMGKCVAGITKLFHGKNAKCKMIYKMSFGAYGKPFKNGNWLSRDEKNWEEYARDPYCGTVCSANFYLSFFKNLQKIYNPKLLRNIDLDVPLLITSGSADPVGGKNAKLVAKLENMYRNLGVEIVEYKVWDDARHEILNEINKKEVFEYIASFIDEFLPGNRK